MTTVRKLVSIKTIDNFTSIPNADRIEVANVGGWSTVVKKGEFTIGEPVLFFEIDSFLPEGVPEFEFLVNKNSKETINPNTGVLTTGTVLRTVKLRGQISQGLILPLSFGLTAESTQDEVNSIMNTIGVFKYEPVISNENAVGNFPTHIARKTDSERVQNLTDVWLQEQNPVDWFATEKIDGTSATFIMKDNEFRVASRNQELNPLSDTFQTRIASMFNLREILPEGAVIQGEIFGAGIQKNPLKVDGLKFAVFSWECPNENITETFQEFITTHSVPLLPIPFPSTVTEAIEQVNGMVSSLNPKVQAEGVVWWNKQNINFSELGDRPNFKAINNKFLLKHGG